MSNLGKYDKFDICIFEKTQDIENLVLTKYKFDDIIKIFAKNT